MQSNIISTQTLIIVLIVVLCLIILFLLYRRLKKRPMKEDSHLKRVEFENSKLFPLIISEIRAGHNVKLNLRGYSMRPFLEHDRDAALLIQPGPPKVGQPVLAEVSPGRYVLHRIVSVKGDDVLLRGDGNFNCEEIKAGDIRAGVAGFYRKGRETMDTVDGWKWRTYSWVWLHIPLKFRMIFLSFYRRLWLKHFKAI